MFLQLDILLFQEWHL